MFYKKYHILKDTKPIMLMVILSTKLFVFGCTIPQRGYVVDADTKMPIKGALVHHQSTKQHITVAGGVTVPGSARSIDVYTNKKGFFSYWPNRRGEIIVIKPGYWPARVTFPSFDNTVLLHKVKYLIDFKQYMDFVRDGELQRHWYVDLEPVEKMEEKILNLSCQVDYKSCFLSVPGTKLSEICGPFKYYSGDSGGYNPGKSNTFQVDEFMLFYRVFDEISRKYIFFDLQGQVKNMKGIRLSHGTRYRCGKSENSHILGNRFKSKSTSFLLGETVLGRAIYVIMGNDTVYRLSGDHNLYQDYKVSIK